MFCIGTDGWVAEWTHATLGRNGKTMESNNSFVYRFEGDQIAEMWMFVGALPRGRPRRSSRDDGSLVSGRLPVSTRWGHEDRADGVRRTPLGRCVPAPVDASRRRRLDVDDLERLGMAAYLTGHDEDGFALSDLAHQRCIDDGAVHHAAYFGMRLAQGLGFKGDLGRCRGWVDRTARLLDDANIDCVEQGYLEYGLAMMRLFEAGDLAGAHSHFVQAGKIGQRFAQGRRKTSSRITRASARGA